MLDPRRMFRAPISSRGAALFVRECSACHGVNGKGGEIGPSLRNEHIRRTYHDVRSFILSPGPPMPKLYPSRLSANEVRDVSAYVESL